MNPSLTIFVLGLLLMLVTRISAQAAERRANRSYQELLARSHQKVGRAKGQRVTMRDSLEGDPWGDVRPVVGVWGCLSLVLRFLFGLAVFLTLSSAFYLIYNLI
ncbi:MAG: hypothetical protein PVG14_11405 [Anaerolineales bacterium]|jgi:hypothetical protein